jgi:hypothetical protein
MLLSGTQSIIRQIRLFIFVSPLLLLYYYYCVTVLLYYYENGQIESTSILLLIGCASKKKKWNRRRTQASVGRVEATPTPTSDFFDGILFRS